MQSKHTCKRCKHLDVAHGYAQFNHYCTLSLELLGDDEITKHTCSNFELKHKTERAAVSIFKYVLGANGKYSRYYLSDEEVIALFERRQQTSLRGSVTNRGQKSRSTL